MAHYTYIIYSETFDLYYKGETVDFSKRLDDHNAGLSRFTAGKGPWKLGLKGKKPIICHFSYICR
jgi:predicted GIY-YIG superfamily endonuclease